MKTRRQFLSTLPLGAAAAVAVSLPGAERLARHFAHLRYRMLDELDPAAFAACLNSPFRVSAEGSPSVDVELVSVDEAEDSPAAGGFERFSLLFRGPADRPLPQSTYAVEHRELGQFHLFIVPVMAGPEGLHYEAVFNRKRGVA